MRVHKTSPVRFNFKGFRETIEKITSLIDKRMSMLLVLGN